MAAKTERRRTWPAYALGVASVLAAGLLWNTLVMPQPAYAQVPDSGAQRNDMIKELRTSNEHLSQAVALLKEIRDLQKRETKEEARNEDAKPPRDKPRP